MAFLYKIITFLNESENLRRYIANRLNQPIQIRDGAPFFPSPHTNVFRNVEAKNAH